MYRASAEVLAAIAQLGGTTPLTSAGALREHMLALLRQFVSNCRELRIPDGETAEARYAIVALIDEQVLRFHWPGRADWMSQPLQMHFYRETTAGENFFQRMGALNARGSSRLGLEAYYLCIALGFAGAPTRGGGTRTARDYAEAARPRLLDGLNPAHFAPNAIPAERPVMRATGFPMALLIGIACAIICVAALVALHSLVGQAIAVAETDLGPNAAAPLSPERKP
ncbi:MAG: DotU family type IV/VI secretion system protein [Polyangiaceae bacterium]|nr:DotU family type IV/VI secretion system protein [Polyangiaceae bacterium]